MKDIIYFDKQLANSYLAQIDEGLLIKAVAGSKSLQSNEKSSSDSSKKTGGIGVGIPAVGKVDGKYEKTITEMEAAVYSSENNELIETALDDYTLDVLINKLTESGKINQDVEKGFSDGSFVKVCSELKAFDLHHLSKISEPDLLSLMIPTDFELERKKHEKKKLLSNKAALKSNKDKIEKLTEEITNEDSYGAVYNFSEFSKELLPNTILLKINKMLSFCSSDNMRMSSSMLSTLSLSNRKATLLGITIAKKSIDSFDLHDIQLEPNEVVEKFSNIMLDTMLANFGLTEIGDYFVRPIAIYYEMK